jgi:hypothetical protein
LVAGSSEVAGDIELRIEVLVEGIVNTVVSTVEAEHTLFEEQVCLCCGKEGYHIQHRNLRLDYSVVHNWRKWEQLVLLRQREQLIPAYFDHSWCKMPFL